MTTTYPGGARSRRAIEVAHTQTLATHLPTTAGTNSMTTAPMLTTAACAWCGAPLPPSRYRPRKWCSDACRRELIRAKRDLVELEGQLAEARYQRDQSRGVRRDRWVREVSWLTPRVRAARTRIPEEMQ